jgi:transcriptional regulator with XRE-family HTH domain
MSLPITTSPAVGRAIRTTRERARLPIGRVAQASGLATPELDAIESGRTRPSIALLDRIARALGSNLVDLVRGANHDPSHHALPEPTSDSSPRLSLSQIARAIAELPVKGGSKIDAAESAVILYAMSVCNDNQSAAARMLLMERKAFVRRLRRARRRTKK